MESQKNQQNKDRTRRFFTRYSSRQRIITGAMLFIICTIFAFIARPPHKNGPSQPSFLSWLFTPLDPSAEARKPFINSDLQAITLTPDSSALVAVGTGGLIIRSEDKGKSWEPQIISLTTENIDRLTKRQKKRRDVEKGISDIPVKKPQPAKPQKSTGKKIDAKKADTIRAELLKVKARQDSVERTRQVQAYEQQGQMEQMKLPDMAPGQNKKAK